MRNLMKSLWRDDGGFVISAELVLISTILVLGLIVGLTALQSAVVGELNDVAGAFRHLDQSYMYHGMSSRGWCGRACGCVTKSFTAGSFYVDRGCRTVVECELSGPCLQPTPAVPETPKLEPIPQPQPTEAAPGPAVPAPPTEGPKIINPQPCPCDCPGQPPCPQVAPQPQRRIIPNPSGCVTCEPRPLEPGAPLIPLPDRQAAPKLEPKPDAPQPPAKPEPKPVPQKSKVL